MDARRLVSTIMVAGILVIGLAGPVKIVREQLASSAPATTYQPGAAAGPAVHMAGLAFAPKVLTVPKGAEVQFVNDDTAPHTVTADAAGGVDSGTLKPGTTFRLTVDQGFAYHCAIHPSMTAEVRVNG